MTEEIQKLLPLIQSGELSKEELDELEGRVRSFIKSDPDSGKTLGPVMSMISQARKKADIRIDINWVPVHKGFLAIGHKPGGRISFEGLKQTGTTAVITLLHENEGALQIGHQLEKQKIIWKWFPFSASSPHSGNQVDQVYDLFSSSEQLLAEGARIYIHCSAGIHRTGMISYGLLRYLGYPEAEALQKLRSLREVTAEQVGSERLQWANQFFRR